MRNLKLKRILRYAIYVLIFLIIVLWTAFGMGYCFSIGPFLLLCPNILYVLIVTAAILFAVVTLYREEPIRKIVYTILVTPLILLIIFYCFDFISEPVVTKIDVKETEKSILLIEYNEAVVSIGYVCERVNPFLLKMDTEYMVDSDRTAHNLGYKVSWNDNKFVLKITGHYIKEVQTTIEK